MAKLKLYYKIGMIGAIIGVVLGLIFIVLHSLTSYISFFGVVSAGAAVTDNILFSVIAILGTEFSRRKKDVGLTIMAVISIAGIIAFPGIFIIGYVIILVAVALGLMEKK
jgi:hypothetical protein